jgi:hypothetical protein
MVSDEKLEQSLAARNSSTVLSQTSSCELDLLVEVLREVNLEQIQTG